MENDLKDRPFWALHETPSAGRQDEGVPCCDSKRADKEVLVCTEVGRKVERVGEEGGDVA